VFEPPPPPLPTHGAIVPREPGPPCYQGFTITLKTHHTSRQNFSRRVNSPAQRPLPDKTQHSQERDIPRWDSNLQSWQASVPQTHALDRAAVGIASTVRNYHKNEHHASDLSLPLCAAIFRSTVRAYSTSYFLHSRCRRSRRRSRRKKTAGRAQHPKRRWEVVTSFKTLEVPETCTNLKA